MNEFYNKSFSKYINTGGIKDEENRHHICNQNQTLKKLAELIGSAIEVKAKNITENPVLNDFDLLFMVGGIYGGASLPELLKNIKKLEAPSFKQAVLVISCASGKQKQDEVRRILEEKRIDIIDELVYKGAFLFVSIKHPNSKDI